MHVQSKSLEYSPQTRIKNIYAMPLYLNAPSTPSSEDASHTTPRIRPNQPSRPKTSFAFARPPPQAFYRKWRLQPRLLLQLQQVSNSTRSIPVLDILQSTSFGHRIAPLFPSMIRSNNLPILEDLMIIKSGSYKTYTEDEPGIESRAAVSEPRDKIATICHSPGSKIGKPGKWQPRIRFEKGKLWEATQLPTGSYDFVEKADHPEKAVRWACRRKGSSRRASPNPDLIEEDNKHFVFSVIEQGARRHPVIARMSRASIEVNDVFSRPVTTEGGPEALAYSSEEESSDSGAVDLVAVGEELRNLILVTGAWVALREGWAED